MKLDLNNITLVAVTHKEIRQSIEALLYSSQHINFQSIKLFSPKHHYPYAKKIENIHIKNLNSISEWGEFIIFELYKYIESKFIILIHPDGFIVNPQSWEPRFLEYDYIGAPWPDSKEFYNTEGKACRVGNSVSLRSYDLLSRPTELGLKWDDAKISNYHEDGFVGVQNRSLLESTGIKFPNLKIASLFSREYTFQENRKVNPFAFHKWYGENKKFPKLGKKIKITDKIKDIYLGFKYR